MAIATQVVAKKRSPFSGNVLNFRLLYSSSSAVIQTIKDGGFKGKNITKTKLLWLHGIIGYVCE